MEELEGFLRDAARRTDAELERCIPLESEEPKLLHSAIRWSVFGGGKRLRPALLMATGRVFEAADEELASAAAAIEMIHTYSLIHDDLPAMDDDDLRRGRATCHVKFGEAAAILAGDALQSLAFRAIAADARLTDGVRLKLIDELAVAATRMVAGQQADLEAEGREVSIEELEGIHRNKTGALICFAARAGCIIAGAGRDDLNAVTKYSESLGLLFQITDDVLDVTQTTQTLGKTAAKDLAAAKATYPSFYGVERSRELATRVHAEAVGHLSEIDRPTNLLEQIAGQILARTA